MGLWNRIKTFINERILRRKPKVTKKGKLQEIEEEVEEEKKDLAKRNIKINKELKQYKENELLSEERKEIQQEIDKQERKENLKLSREQKNIIAKIDEEEIEKTYKIPKIVPTTPDEEAFMQYEAETKQKEILQRIREAPTIQAQNKEIEALLKEEYGTITYFEGEDTIEAYNEHLAETIRNNLEGESPRLIQQIIENIDKQEGRFTTILTAETELGMIEAEFYGQTIRNVKTDLGIEEGTTLDLSNLRKTIENKKGVTQILPSGDNKSTITLRNVRWGTTFK